MSNSNKYSQLYPFLIDNKDKTWSVDGSRKNDLLSKLVFLNARKNDHVFVTNSEGKLDVVHEDKLVAKYGETPPKDTKAIKPVVTYHHGASQKAKDPNMNHYSRDGQLPTLIQRGQFQFLGLEVNGEQIAFTDADRRITEEEEGVFMYEQAKAITKWLHNTYSDAKGKARVARHIKAATKPVAQSTIVAKNIDSKVVSKK